MKGNIMEPFGLPRSSTRMLVTFILSIVICFLIVTERIHTHAPNTELQITLAIILGFYFGRRSGNKDEKIHPLYLSQQKVILVIWGIVAVTAVYAWVRDGVCREPIIYIVALIAAIEIGHFAKIKIFDRFFQNESESTNSVVDFAYHLKGIFVIVIVLIIAYFVFMSSYDTLSLPVRIGMVAFIAFYVAISD